MSSEIDRLYNMLDAADLKAQAGDEQAAKDAKEIYGMIKEQQLETKKGNDIPPVVAGMATAPLGIPSAAGYVGKKGYEFLKDAGAVSAIKKYVAENAQGSKVPNAPSATDIILAKDIDQAGTSGHQRDWGKNILSDQLADKAKEGEKLVERIKAQGGMPKSAPTNPLVNAPTLIPSQGGILYPANEAYAAEQTARTAANAPRTVGQRAMGAFNTAKAAYNPLMKVLGPVAGAYQMGSEGADAYNRFNRDDYIGGGLSAIGSVAGAASLYPPLAPIAVPVSAAASGANWARDEYLKRRGQPQTETLVHPAQYANGGLVYLR
jgi:hypothetical protein